MSGYKVDPVKVQELGGHIKAGSGRIEEAMRDITSKIHGVGGSWEGTAKNAFIEVSEDWRTTQEKIRLLLSDIGDGTLDSGRCYEETENNVRNVWRR